MKIDFRTSGQLLARNTLTQIAFALVQAAGWSDLTAKLHLAELPCYFVGIWFLIRTDGIDGAAIAWVGRIIVDTIALLLMAKHVLPQSSASLRALAVGMAVTLTLLAFAALPVDRGAKGLFLLIALSIFAVIAWTSMVDDADRAVARKWLGLRNSP